MKTNNPMALRGKYILKLGVLFKLVVLILLTVFFSLPSYATFLTKSEVNVSTFTITSTFIPSVSYLPTNTLYSQSKILLYNLFSGSKYVQYADVSLGIIQSYAINHQTLLLIIVGLLLALLIVLIGHFLLVFRRQKRKGEFEKHSNSFHVLYDNMYEGVAIHELVFEGGEAVNYKIISTNKRYNEIVKKTDEDVIGKLATEIYKTATAPYLNEFSTVALTKIPVLFETYFEPQEKYYRISVAPWGNAGFATIFADITIPKKATIELQQSQEKFSKLFYNNPASIFIIDTEKYQFIDVNQTFEEFNHHPREYFIGKSVFDFFSYTNQDEILRKLGSIQEGESVRNLLLEGRTNDGELRYNLVSAERIMIDNTSCILVSSVILDDYYRALSQIKDREQKLKVSEHYFKTLIDNAPVGILSVNKEGEITYVSQKIIDIFKLRSDYIQKPESIFNWVKPENVSFVKKRLFKLMARSEQPELMEFEFINGEGEYFWADIQSAIIKDSKDNVKGLFIFINEITQRRNDELKIKETLSLLNSTFESSTNAIVIVNNKKQIVEYNRKYLQMFGLPDFPIGESEDVILQKVQDIIYNYEDFMRKIESLYEQQNTTSFDIIALKDGRFVERHSRPQYVDGKIVGRVWSFLDVTERKTFESEQIRNEKKLLKSESQLRKYAQHLQEVREEERMYISRELHDNMGQLLTALRIDIFRLAKKTSDIELPQVKEIHDEMKLVITYVDSVIQSVRKISRELRPVVLEDLGLLAAIENLVKDFQAKMNIQCTLSSEVESLKIDKDHEIGVYRIIQESLTNVFRHAKASQVAIDIHKMGKIYLITVADNGIGITKSQMRTSKSLGLLSMNERATLFNGKVSIKGIIGKGTTISIQIPIL